MNPLFHAIGTRLPARNDILHVFGVVLFAVFGWSIRGFLYKIPAFTLYFGISTNLAILSYMLSFALLESVLVMVALLAVAAILPAQALRRGFAYKGFLVILVATLAMILFEGYFQIGYFKDMMAGMYYMVQPFVIGLASCVLALIGLLWFFHARPAYQKYLLYATEQLSVFTYIYVPLGLIGLAVVIVRNLL